LSGRATIYSRIDGDFDSDVAAADLNGCPVQIVAIDGAYQLTSSAPLEPGSHTLIPASKKSTHFHFRAQKSFPFKVEPCTSYYPRIPS